ncbi:hypothetical protein F5B21DRAFT_224460 [Xylaria acuta]|nr:hypothetical protein F5B21DRAFT_224460 [Xylaria acuta]
MTLPSPLHRHQLSLEGLIDFSTEVLSLESSQRTNAQHRFYRIAKHFETDGPVNDSNHHHHHHHHHNNDRKTTRYSPSRLVRLTYEHALSEQSRDSFLRAFFSALALSIDGQQEEDDLEDLRSPFFGFADYLLDNFFLPCFDEKDSATLPRVPFGHRESPGGRILRDIRTCVGSSRCLSRSRPSSLCHLAQIRLTRGGKSCTARWGRRLG